MNYKAWYLFYMNVYLIVICQEILYSTFQLIQGSQEIHLNVLILTANLKNLSELSFLATLYAEKVIISSPIDINKFDKEEQVEELEY